MPASRLTLSSAHPRTTCSGFALLLTITLLAFLVLLLVGLATYTRIETAIVGNSQRQAQARENALLALNVALGQLQKHAGPDRRVTATAEAFSNGPGTSHYTGVWATDGDPLTPLTWLVSGNELSDTNGTAVPLAVTPDSAITTANSVALVSTNTSRTANDVLVRLVPITAPGVPGVSAGVSAPIGRYAWWVGDQGVKAPVAVPDTTDAIAFAPYDSADLRTRIRQQIAMGAGAADGNSGAPVFETRDTNNAPLVAGQKIIATNQLAFLRSSANTALGLTRVQQNFHAWSPNNFAVLANTKAGGLRQDLSLKPDLLGNGFAAWANYTSYMEDPAAGAASAFPPMPEITNDSIRRRHVITPALFSSDTGISPVLNYFYILFGVRKQNANAPYTLSLRWAAALWNPYTSALVPEDLRLEISGLPESLTMTFIDPVTRASIDDVTVDLRQHYGNPLKVTLPWTASSTPTPQEQSWLPGRVYNWTFLPNQSFQVGAEQSGRFQSRDLGSFASGLTVSVPGSASVNGNSQLALRVAFPTQLTVKLTRANGDLLASYTKTYDAVPTTAPGVASNQTSQLGFLFRLSESVDTVATPDVWLQTAGRDPRSGNLPPDSLVAVPNGTDPAAYQNFDRVRAPDRLLDRDVSTGKSYNEDVPLFELPRAPLLSLGVLQHFYIPDARPFSLGNSWGQGIDLKGINGGQLFDRFYFSGLADNITPDETGVSWSLPNPLLKRLRNPETGMFASAADLRGAQDARSAKFLLAGSAFNLNSTNSAAWAAVLRSVRFPAPTEFKYLDADGDTGTAAPSGEATTSLTSNDAQFFRFSQSGQEIFKADDGYVQSTTQSGNETEVIATPLFRRGMKTLTASQVAMLASKIADAIKARHLKSGPFRSLEEFVGPLAPGSPSLLEQAIADTHLNINSAGDPLEFSSQFLTQADIMTALAPVLFPRSDTFVIRAYGEALNPITSTSTVPVVEGRAWCEAIVQRVPEYFDAKNDPAETAPDALTSDLNQLHGRRFKVVSFRWLTRSDI